MPLSEPNLPPPDCEVAIARRMCNTARAVIAL
jgi:hypothetical protein